MSTTVVPPAEPKLFDPLAHMNDRNAAEHAGRNGKPAPEPAKVEPAKEAEKPAPAAAKPPEPEEHRPSRSDRRRERRMAEEIGAERARREILEQRIAELEGKGRTEPTAADPEPARDAFATDSEYDRAMGRWEARQEAKKAIGAARDESKTEQETAAYREHLRAMDTKFQADVKTLADWDAVAAAAAENEDAPEIDFSKDLTLTGLLASSDERARLLYHFAKNPDALQAFLDLRNKPQEIIKRFHRLEGKVEKLYTTEQQKPAAQAAEPEKPAKEDRTHPAEGATPGRTAEGRDALKPRPSSEVAARGGSAPPEEPEIGSAAWMAKRNAAEGKSRY